MVERSAERGKRKPIVQSVGVVIIETDCVVGVRHSYNTTLGEGVRGVPAGQKDPGETKKQAAVPRA